MYLSTSPEFERERVSKWQYSGTVNFFKERCTVNFVTAPNGCEWIGTRLLLILSPYTPCNEKPGILLEWMSVIIIVALVRDSIFEPPERSLQTKSFKGNLLFPATNTTTRPPLCLFNYRDFKWFAIWPQIKATNRIARSGCGNDTAQKHPVTRTRHSMLSAVQSSAGFGLNSRWIRDPKTSSRFQTWPWFFSTHRQAQTTQRTFGRLIDRLLERGQFSFDNGQAFRKPNTSLCSTYPNHITFS
jgi:hypothetical protein